jgi:hypothetical protein
MNAEQLRDRIAHWEALRDEATRKAPLKGREQDREKVVDTCERMIAGFERRLERLGEK